MKGDDARARLRHMLPLIAMTCARQVSRRMALVWRARSVLETSVVDYDSMVFTATDACRT